MLSLRAACGTAPKRPIEVAKMAVLTNPALEMAELVGWLQALPHTNEAAINVFGQAFGVPADAPELLEGIAVVATRLRQVPIFASELCFQKNELDEYHVQQIQQACDFLGTIFRASNLMGSWSNISSNVRPQDATAFNWMSLVAKRHRGLYRLDDEERSHAIGEAEKALIALNEDRSLSGWEREILVAGLERMRLMLNMFRFFGHEYVRRDLVALKSDLNSTVVKLKKSDATAKSINAVMAVVTAVVAILSAVAAPDAAATAIGHYHQLLEGKNPYQEQKLLPGPSN